MELRDRPWLLLSSSLRRGIALPGSLDQPAATSLIVMQLAQLAVCLVWSDCTGFNVGLTPQFGDQKADEVSTYA